MQFEQLVVMSRMDFEIAWNVYQLFTRNGLSDEEVSFLLGKRNKYVIELLDPTKKDKFKTEQLDVLPTILGCTIRELIPNSIHAEGYIKIKASRKVSAKQIVYRFTLPDNPEAGPQTIKRKINKGRKTLHPEVHRLTLRLLEDKFFDEPRNAIELYLLYKRKLQIPFRAADLQKSLSVCLRDRDNGGLERVSILSRYYYKSRIS
jgi:hypothetical protein